MKKYDLAKPFNVIKKYEWPQDIFLQLTIRSLDSDSDGSNQLIPSNKIALPNTHSRCD